MHERSPHLFPKSCDQNSNASVGKLSTVWLGAHTGARMGMSSATIFLPRWCKMQRKRNRWEAVWRSCPRAVWVQCKDSGNWWANRGPSAGAVTLDVCPPITPASQLHCIVGHQWEFTQLNHHTLNLNFIYLTANYSSISFQNVQSIWPIWI